MAVPHRRRAPHRAGHACRDNNPGDQGFRLRGAYSSAHGDAASARLFVCAGCRAQSLICSCCDRGQMLLCRRLRRASPASRAACCRAALSDQPSGRLAHADRTRRYRARCKNVTHHGSPAPPLDDLLPPSSPAIASDAAIPAERPRHATSHCHWCGRRCPEFVRREFLRRRLDRRGLVRHDRTGPNHGHAA